MPFNTLDYYAKQIEEKKAKEEARKKLLTEKHKAIELKKQETRDLIAKNLKANSKSILEDHSDLLEILTNEKEEKKSSKTIFD